MNRDRIHRRALAAQMEMQGVCAYVADARRIVRYLEETPNLTQAQREQCNALLRSLVKMMEFRIANCEKLLSPIGQSFSDDLRRLSAKLDPNKLYERPNNDG